MIARRSALGRQLGLLLAAVVLAVPGLWSQTNVSKTEQIHAHLEKARQELGSNNFASAEHEFRAVLALDPNNVDARGNVGVMQFFQNNWMGAAEQFQKVLQVQPHTWKVQAYLGMCETRLGHIEDARRLLTAALPHLQNGPFETQAGLELAQIDYQADDLDGAVDAVRILLPNNPANADVLYITARVYADLANRSRDALLLTAPESGQTHQLMAEMLINRGETGAAVAQYRKALEVNPKLRGVHYELGEAILQNSRQAPALEAAEKEFRVALAENPRDANAEYRLGTISSLRRDYKTAIDHYTHALQMQPNNAYAQQGLGAAWIKMGEMEKALEHLLAATRLDPLYATSHYQLSSVYRQLGRENDARRELATFEKLEAARKQIDQVYIQTRGELPETGSDEQETPNK